MSISSVVDEKAIAEWLLIEEQFSYDNYNHLKLLNNPYQRASESAQILFCAPHALNHFRHNKIKIADIFTGSLCCLLSEKTNQANLVPVCLSKKSDYLDLGCEYVQRVKYAVESGLIIVDIHGMSDDYGLDVCIGAGPKPSVMVNNLCNYLADKLSDYKVAINSPFNALANYTVTNFVQTRLGGDAIQIEIASHLRNPKYNSTECGIFFERLSQVFKSFLTELE